MAQAVDQGHVALALRLDNKLALPCRANFDVNPQALRRQDVRDALGPFDDDDVITGEIVLEAESNRLRSLR